MQTKDDLLKAGVAPSFFNVLAQRVHVQRGPNSVAHYLNNGEFMRDVAIVTTAFGALSVDEHKAVSLTMPVAGTNYNAALRPCDVFGMGIFHYMYAHGYDLEVQNDGHMAVKGHFSQTAHQPPAKDGSMRVHNADALFEIAEREGNGAGLNQLYREIVKQLPEARSLLQLG